MVSINQHCSTSNVLEMLELQAIFNSVEYIWVLLTAVSFWWVNTKLKGTLSFRYLKEQSNDNVC